MFTEEPHVKQAGVLLTGVHSLLFLDWALSVAAPTELDVLVHAAVTEPSLPCKLAKFGQPVG